MRHASSHPRAGFSLAELMVTMVLLGIVGGAILNVIIRQQRFYRATDEVIAMRTRLRDATAILPVDLRSVGPQRVNGSVGDIIAITENSVTFRSTFGSAIACVANVGTTIHMPPAGRLASGVTYTSFLTEPAVGDEVALFNETANTWTLTNITAAPSASGGVCPSGAGPGFFRRAADADGLQINVAAVGVGVQAGSPVRFLKRVKYGLYKAGDGKWYLGFDFVTGDGATWSPQPVSGPYRAHYAALDARNGLRIRCYHRNGTELGLDVCATSDSLNRLDFTFRSETNAAVAKTGLGTTETLVDSMTVRVALRNNS